jgi:Ner family transcriptional regulator
MKPSQKAKQQDWHNADIKAGLEKAGWTLSKLAAAHGYARSTLCAPLKMAWPKGERIIANTLGTTPQTIWPSRYDDDGAPISGRRIRHNGLVNQKFNTGISQCNVEIKAGV